VRLTLQTDYALRFLMHLAVQGDTLTTISESAERHSISKNHLMKVAHNLRQLGYVSSVRGRAGGLRLACLPDAISIGRLVRDFEEHTALVACFPGGTGACHITPACRLKGMLAEALEAFYAILDRYTLEDLVGGNHELKQLLIVGG